MVFEEPVVDRDAVWSLCQAPIYEPQKRPLGFWSKALLSSVKEITAVACVTDKVKRKMAQRITSPMGEKRAA